MRAAAYLLLLVADAPAPSPPGPSLDPDLVAAFLLPASGFSLPWVAQSGTGGTYTLSADEGEEPTYATSGGAGGGARLIFAGAQRLVLDQSLTLLADWTVECWFSWGGSGGATQALWTNDLDLSNFSRNQYAANSGVNNLLSFLYDPNFYQLDLSGTPVAAAAYSAVWYDGDAGRFRGQRDAEAVVDSDPRLNAQDPRDFPWQVGNSTLNEPLTGDILGLRIWKRALSDAERAASRAAGPYMLPTFTP